jgi:dimethylglycine dehydrogenase
MGYVPAELARADKGFEVEILGEMRPARIQTVPLIDPKGARMRG